ncbi:MAG: hypothetical protein GY715_02525 [Planctomycetes bacterium]|nr:hypothetical protein [Planctomycetota bacterium]
MSPGGREATMRGMPECGSRLVAGAMTGTSMDGIDVALARIEGTGLSMRAELVRHRGTPLDALADALRTATGRPDDEHAPLARALGSLHADAFAALLDGARPDFVAAHGQTIFHRPPVSRQLLDPDPIVARIGCPVVFDLRRADLAAGGQGAPITPLADWILFRHAGRRRAIVNLGGFCNVTVLPGGAEDAIDEITALDVCACNHVLDAVARTALGTAFDADGAAAARGRPDAALADALRSLLDEQRCANRSLGTDDEGVGWVAEHARDLAPEDLAATVVNAVARVIATTVGDTDEVVVAGGGARNGALVAAIARHARGDMTTSNALGVPVEAREALAMAVLGTLCRDGVPITLPQVTGCGRPAPVAGVWAAP